MKKSDKTSESLKEFDKIDKEVEEQVHEEKNLNFRKMLLWLVGLVIFFSLIAWASGYITVGGPGKSGRFGAIRPQDSAAVVKNDSLKAE